MQVFPIGLQAADSTVAASYNSTKVYAVNTAGAETEYLITIKQGATTVATITIEGQQAMVIGKSRTNTIVAANALVKFTPCGPSSE